MNTITLVIHGGAGTIMKEDMTPELESAYQEGLRDALNAGFAVLEEGGSAVNAVKAAIVIMEDNILFNAGPWICLYQKRLAGNGCCDYGWQYTGSWCSCRCA